MERSLCKLERRDSIDGALRRELELRGDLPDCERPFAAMSGSTDSFEPDIESLDSPAAVAGVQQGRCDIHGRDSSADTASSDKSTMPVLKPPSPRTPKGITNDTGTSTCSCERISHHSVSQKRMLATSTTRYPMMSIRASC